MNPNLNSQAPMKASGAKLRKTVLRIALLVIVAVIVGLAVYNINAQNLLGNRLPMPFGFGVSVVLSGSMEPELSKYDLIFVSPTEDFYQGQVVVFQDGESLVVHRIHHFEGDEVVTKGDANDAADSAIPKSAIKGELVGVIPFVGLFVLILQNPLAVVLLLALAVFLVERSYRTEREEKHHELDDIKKEIEELVSQLKK